MTHPAEAIPPVAIETPETARDLVLRLADTMDKLLELVETETEVLRVGEHTHLDDIEAGKVMLARRYIRDIECLKANAPYIGQAIPELVAEFREGYAQFRAALQVNLAVLAPRKGGAAHGGAAHAGTADGAAYARAQAGR
ncbi:hypothetical protein [Blastochloris sulfoviridis]|uniref:Flagellar protein FlgN n=1 Tax=Blastochloris sulfoviridis TaxID=50712 RepID=A0A5M6I4N6_9HYPH|nr:hypothetical protein [Blastochloris sulfoviridis]KAA5602765.1 hypothetical protein F1193_04605 [Blastochloris sulfoviridis]